MTFKGKPFSMSWCLECHREPEKFIYADPAKTDMTPREQVFDLYRKIQAGDELTAREKDIAAGNMGARKADEKLTEEQLEKFYRMKKKQLEDCWICHR